MSKIIIDDSWGHTMSLVTDESIAGGAAAGAGDALVVDQAKAKPDPEKSQDSDEQEEKDENKKKEEEEEQQQPEPESRIAGDPLIQTQLAQYVMKNIQNMLAGGMPQPGAKKKGETDDPEKKEEEKDALDADNQRLAQQQDIAGRAGDAAKKLPQPEAGEMADAANALGNSAGVAMQANAAKGAELAADAAKVATPVMQLGRVLKP